MKCSSQPSGTAKMLKMAPIVVLQSSGGQRSLSPPGLFLFARLFFRNRVISMPAPRVAAQYAPQGESRPFEGAEPFNRLECVSGAGRRKAAGRLCMGGDGPLVKPDQCDQHPFHAGNTPAFRRWAAITPARTVLFIGRGAHPRDKHDVIAFPEFWGKGPVSFPESRGGSGSAPRRTQSFCRS